jgi:hypothetical protein
MDITSLCCLPAYISLEDTPDMTAPPLVLAGGLTYTLRLLADRQVGIHPGVGTRNGDESDKRREKKRLRLVGSEREPSPYAQISIPVAAYVSRTKRLKYTLPLPLYHRLAAENHRTSLEIG